MSWNFKISGAEREAVKAEIEKSTHCPAEFRAALGALVDKLDLKNHVPEGKPFGIYVDSDGHVDSYSGFGRFNVNRVTRAE